MSARQKSCEGDEKLKFRPGSWLARDGNSKMIIFLPQPDLDETISSRLGPGGGRHK
jgi:hypothetical protein